MRSEETKAKLSHRILLIENIYIIMVQLLVLPSSSLILLLVLLMMAPSSSCAQEQEQEQQQLKQQMQEHQQQHTMLQGWIKEQVAKDAAAGCTCGKKDAALSAAEANRVVLHVEPADDSSTSDPAIYLNSIGEAIAKIPDGNTKRYIISIQPGAVYREKLFLGKNKPFVTLASTSPEAPAIIAWNDTAATLGKDGKPLGAEGSSSVTIESDFFIASGILFRNDAPEPELKRDNQGKIGEVTSATMAPALRVAGSKATFYKCTVDGGHGALYDHKGLHYYKSCTINGTFDFIFGNARSFYEDCNIVSKSATDYLGDLPVAKPPLTLSPAAADGGFSFKTCTITGQSFIFLGRAGWPVVYSYTNIGYDLFPLIVSGSDDSQAGAKFQFNRYHY